MQKVLLRAVVDYSNELMKVSQFTDWPGAANGLQVENSGTISKIAAAVDGTVTTIRKAASLGADFLLVHHGLFWTPSHPWTGRRYEMIRDLVTRNMAVYSCHLPLDAHPELGNNALLCQALGLRNLKPFFFEKGQYLGFQAKANVERDVLARGLEDILGAPPKVLPGGPEVCRRIGVVTGGAGNELKTAAAEGVDTFITGEGVHWTYALAEDMGINVFYGGHYATETFGVKALAAHLSRRFRIPWVFVDHPTGL